MADILELESILRTVDLGQFSFTEGDHAITVTALSTGLTESAMSNTGDYTSGGFEYALTTDDKGNQCYELTGVGSISTPNIVIPDTFNNLPVRYIGSNAFTGNSVVASVTFTQNLYGIKANAFNGAAALTTIRFPSECALKYIGEGAFEDTPLTAAHNIPRSIEEIQNSAFANSSLEELDFEQCLDIYFHDARGWNGAYLYWWNDDNNTNNGWPGQSMVREGANYHLCIPAGVTGIIFHNNDGWQTDDIKGNDIVSFRIYEKGMGEKDWYTAGEVSRIQHGVTIGGRAFYNCNLQNVKLPDHVTRIEGDAFMDSGLVTFDMGRSVTYIGASAFQGNRYLNSITLSNCLEEIGNQAFYNTGAFQSNLVIPDSVHKIGMNVFTNTSFADGFGIELEDHYGWFVAYWSDETQSETELGGAIHYSKLDTVEKITAAFKTQLMDDYLVKVDQMIAPTISIDHDTLTINDYTGLAETFNIFINGKKVAIVNALTGEITEL